MKRMPLILKFAFFRVNLLRIVKNLLEQLLKFSKPLFGHPSRTSNENYTFFLTEATYSPWVTNDEFKKDMKNISKKDIALSLIQLYEIWNTVKLVENINGAIVEVGVWRGSSIALIDISNRKCGNLKEVVGFDTFEGVALASDKDPLYVGGEHADTSIQFVKKNLSNYSPNNTIKLFKGIFPTETGNSLPSNVSLAHIDVDTYESTLQSLRTIWTRLSVGGVIICTDYGSCTATGVPEAVHNFLNETDNASFTYSIGGSAILTKY